MSNALRNLDILSSQNDDILHENMTAKLLRLLESFLSELLLLDQIQTRVDGVTACYEAAYRQLEQSMVRLVRDARLARLPIHLGMLRRSRNGHKQIYLYWFENAQSQKGPVEPMDFISEFHLKQFELIQARHIQLQANHLTLMNVRDIFNRVSLSLKSKKKSLVSNNVN